MLQILFSIFAITIVQIARAQPSDDLCAGCIIVNGAGFKDHPECDKFIQCRDYGNGTLVGQVMNCPFATHWDLNLLTCLPIGETQCDNDRCLKMTDDAVYGVDTNCRGYMKCMGGISKPMCCAYNETYVDGTGCVNDINDVCNDTCFGVSESKLYPKKCDLLPVPSDSAKYQQFVLGWGMLTLDCPIGTYFVKDACDCIGFIKSEIKKPVCKPEIHLPFTQDHLDKSGRGNYVENQNVEIRNGVAIFNGKNSRLVIPRFTNLEHSTTVVIKIKYSSKHEAWTGMAHALISNSDCGNLPSVMISEDNSNIYFGVGTDETKFAYTFVPQRLVDPTLPRIEKTVEYRFKNGELVGNNGIDTEKTAAPGYLRNVRCAFHIGHAEKLQPFEGEIDEISIYLCDPDTP